MNTYRERRQVDRRKAQLPYENGDRRQADRRSGVDRRKEDRRVVEPED